MLARSGLSTTNERGELMNENLKALLKALDEDEALLEAYRSATEGKEGAAHAEATVAFANEHGFALASEDLEAFGDVELQDAELAAVAGGFTFDCVQNYLGPYPNNPRTPVRNVR